MLIGLEWKQFAQKGSWFWSEALSLEQRNTVDGRNPAAVDKYLRSLSHY